MNEKISIRSLTSILRTRFQFRSNDKQKDQDPSLKILFFCLVMTDFTENVRPCLFSPRQFTFTIKTYFNGTDLELII